MIDCGAGASGRLLPRSQAACKEGDILLALKIQTDTYLKRSLPHGQPRQQRTLLFLPLILFFTMVGVILLGSALLSFSSGYSWLFGTVLGYALLVGPFAERALPLLPGSLFIISNGEGTVIFVGMFAIVFV